MFKELHTQLDDISECAHDNETDTDGTGDLNELALVRYGKLALVHPLLPSIKVSMPSVQPAELWQPRGCRWPRELC